MRKRQERSWGDENRDDGLVVRQKETQAGDEKREAIYKAMQQVLGQEEVRFRSVEQEQAMHAVLDG